MVDSATSLSHHLLSLTKTVKSELYNTDEEKYE